MIIQTCKQKRLIEAVIALYKEDGFLYRGKSEISIFNKSVSLLGAWRDQKTLAFACYLTDEVLTTFLAEIIIDKTHRRKELGQQLIDEIHKNIL